MKQAKLEMKGKPAKSKGAAHPPPPSLTHYTDLNGFLGIVNSGEIWASNVSFLNDRRELLYGLDSAAKAVRKFSSRATYGEWHKPLDSVLTRFREGRIPNTYAACFCEKSDLLSQWRGYGGREQAIALTLDRDHLKRHSRGRRRS